MVATLMQALDNSIANVALPYMQGSLSATADQITWVLTFYVVAAAIFTVVCLATACLLLPLRRPSASSADGQARPY